MYWVLQNNIFNEAAWDTLVETLTRLEIPFSEHKVIPFIGQLEPDINPGRNVICIGSYSMRWAAVAKQWRPGVFDLYEYHFEYQLSQWGDHMLNYDCEIVEFQHAKFTREEMFVRPIHDTKVFAGAIMTQSAFEEWQHKVCVLNDDYGTSLESDTLVQLCVPRAIYAEYRFWVVDGRIVTYSLYKRGNKVMYLPEAPETVIEYAKARIEEWQPKRAFVIDVCECEDGIKIVEINTINSCGFYAADIQRLVIALQTAFSDNCMSSGDQ